MLLQKLLTLKNAQQLEKCLSRIFFALKIFFNFIIFNASPRASSLWKLYILFGGENIAWRKQMNCKFVMSLSMTTT